METKTCENKSCLCNGWCKEQSTTTNSESPFWALGALYRPEQIKEEDAKTNATL